MKEVVDINCKQKKGQIQDKSNGIIIELDEVASYSWPGSLGLDALNVRLPRQDFLSQDE